MAAQYGALAVTWGASFLFIKVGLDGLSPGQVVLGRLVAGALTLAVISAARRSRLPRDPVAWANLAVVAVLLCDAPFLLFAWAEQRIPSGLASIYNAATPLMTAMWGLAVLPGERPTRARLAGLVTGFAGVALVLGPWHLASRRQLLAQLACLAATACYGAGFTYLRRYVSPRGIAALPAATLQVSTAGKFTLPRLTCPARHPRCLRVRRSRQTRADLFAHNRSRSSSGMSTASGQVPTNRIQAATALPKVELHLHMDCFLSCEAAYLPYLGYSRLRNGHGCAGRLVPGR